LGDHVVLVGLMGSGKSTVGRLVAERLGRPFVDSDEQVESATGRTVREIWSSDGEEAFRRFEAEALAAAVASPRPAVIAAAGGTVLDARNREVLSEAGVVVWLDADPAVLADRAASGDHRPLLDDDPVGALAKMSDERAELYREVATHIIDVGVREPDDVADEVLALVPA
jgi:shikimate kinase